MKNKNCGECLFFNMHGVPCRKDFTMPRRCEDEACSKYQDYKKMTNGDKMRQMSDEELVATIEELSLRFTGKSEFIAWLKQEAKDE